MVPPSECSVNIARGHRLWFNPPLDGEGRRARRSRASRGGVKCEDMSRISMAADQDRSPGTAWAKAMSPGFVLAVYATAIFLSAALLFAVQPLFAKMVLPRLGGSPSVWSVAMVFFQAVLLAGYAYAHALTSYLPGKRSMIVHLVVMVAATLFLPLAIAPWWGRPPADATAAIWLLGLFTVSIGLPFFALSAHC